MVKNSGIASVFGLAAVVSLAGCSADPEFIGLCDSYPGVPEEGGITAGMVYIEAGEFQIGNDHGFRDPESGRFQRFPEEAGARLVESEGFWIDRHEVTNAQFKRFVDATGYVTVAERKPLPEWFPAGYPQDELVPGSAVFNPSDVFQSTSQAPAWWRFVEGASWRQPEGPGSDLSGRMNHPVVHVTFADAQAYASWAGKRLPSEAQWEYAAKAGIEVAEGAWEKAYYRDGEWVANTWQGTFPDRNEAADGYAGTAPVGCFPPNPWGLYDAIGNVWELVSSDYSQDHRKVPTGDFDPSDYSKAGVIKGGSFLCASNYCMRYRPVSRHAQDRTIGSSHIGFRTIYIPKGSVTGQRK